MYHTAKIEYKIEWRLSRTEQSLDAPASYTYMVTCRHKYATCWGFCFIENIAGGA